MNIRKKLKLDENTTLTAYATRWSETQRLSVSHF
jgi:hypothetical protein